MYKKLLILLFVCSSALAMESGNAYKKKVGLLPPLPLLPVSVSDHQPSLFQYDVTSERGTGNGGEEYNQLSEQAAQERIVFGIKCFLCELHLEVESEGMLAEEARRHFFVQHAIVVTWLVLGRLLDGDTIGEDDFIVV